MGLSGSRSASGTEGIPKESLRSEGPPRERGPGKGRSIQKERCRSLMFQPFVSKQPFTCPALVMEPLPLAP